MYEPLIDLCAFEGGKMDLFLKMGGGIGEEQSETETGAVGHETVGMRWVGRSGRL